MGIEIIVLRLLIDFEEILDLNLNFRKKEIKWKSKLLFYVFLSTLKI